MFPGRLPPPKNMNVLRKPPLEKQDISMSHWGGTYAHHARTPNTNYAERWQQHRHHESSSYLVDSVRYADEMRRARCFMQHEEHVERQKLRDTIQSKLHAKVQGYLDALEKRRDKLRNIMAEEERAHIRETVDKAQRADESKFADMKKRSEALKAAKEADRLELVKQKRIQQYSQRCVELRPYLSRKLTEESKLCQLQQMRENEARRQSEAEITRMWDNLLKKQDEAFMEREVQEAIIRYNRCKKDMDILTMQIRAKKHMNEINRQLDRENFKEAQRIRAIQNQEERDEMQQRFDKRIQDAEDLKRQIEVQQQFMDQRKKEEIALDNAFAKLTQLEIQREQAAVVDNRDRLQKEIDTYRHHLEDLNRQRKQEEAQLDAIIADFQRVAQHKQDEVVCKYQAGRRKLVEEVMKERADQVQQNRLRAEKELEHKKVENVMMRDIFETNRRLHDEAKRIHVLSIKEYRNDLNKQIEYNFNTKKKEMDEAERRLQQGLEEERKLEALVTELVKVNLGTQLEHPFRRIIAQYDCKCENAAQPN